MKSWNLRYFILQPGIFRYFKNDPVSLHCIIVTVASNDK